MSEHDDSTIRMSVVRLDELVKKLTVESFDETEGDEDERAYRKGWNGRTFELIQWLLQKTERSRNERRRGRRQDHHG